MSADAPGTLNLDKLFADVVPLSRPTHRPAERAAAQRTVCAQARR